MPRTVVVLVASGFFAFRGVAGAAPCPAPSMAHGRGQCVLAADAVLEHTIVLPASTTLNCRGHVMTPAVVGVDDDPRTPAIEFAPARPALAVFVHGAPDTRIENCVIQGFDFGIFVVDNKTDEGTAIIGNRIAVRTNAISLTHADHTRIVGNDISYDSERGRGIAVELDSDENEIIGNTITSTQTASTGMVQQVPGGLFVTQVAIMDNKIHCLLGDRPLRNLVVEGELIQIAAADATRNPHPDPATIEDSLRTDHNLIEGNTIVDAGHTTSCTGNPDIACRTDADCPAPVRPCLLKQHSGVGFNIRAADTVIRGNSFAGRMERGVSFGGVAAVVTIAPFYPGTCTGDPTRRRMCLDDNDCQIAGLPNLGACTGTASITFNGNTMRLRAEDNGFTGGYDTAALFGNNSDGFTFAGNRVEGGADIVSAIQINPTGVNGTIERNVVIGAGNALSLARSATVRLNDFSGYATAIRSSITTPTVLGGNYWGAPCPGLDPAGVLFPNGSPNPNVSDVSYGVPVAATPDALLPAPCD
jgi:hypothetical protein